MEYLSLLTFMFILFVGSYADCTFKTKTNLELLSKMKPLFGKRYETEDKDYRYYVGMCTDAITGKKNEDNAAVIQIEKNNPNNWHLLGKYSAAVIMQGTNWVYLEYTQGDNYQSHCNGENKRAIILIICDPEATDNGKALQILNEERDINSSCYFLFELGHPEVCDVRSLSGTALSVGSIILIVFGSVAAVYLVVGALYRRLILRAKGIEQIPNYEFWKDFGNLQADGCNFLCRSGESRNSSPYKGVGDDMIEDAEERDDNLLPM